MRNKAPDWQLIYVAVPVAIFFLSIQIIYYLANSLPAPRNSQQTIYEMGIPRSLEQARAIVTVLNDYKETNFVGLTMLVAATYIWKQAFSVPGSAILNIIVGAVYGPYVGIPFVCVLTAAGASCCYGMSHLAGRESGLASMIFGDDRIAKLHETMEIQRKKKNLAFFCIFIRVFPFTPNFFINFASPLVGVPFHIHFLSVLGGLIPYNSVTVNAGSVLSELNSMAELYSPWVVVSLLGISTLFLVPLLCRRQLQHLSPLSNNAHREQ